MLRNVAMNAVGHASGVVLFAIFLALAIRKHGIQKTNWLSLMAASLALLWNLASFAVLLADDQGSTVRQWLAAIGFSVLSLLPTVLFHLCVGRRFPRLVQAGYGLGVAATVCHMAELAVDGADLHRIGLFLITGGFGTLTTIAVVRILWSSDDQPGVASSRTVATMSLFLLAISFVHFGDGHIDQAWAQELLFHHAGIPLALFVLLQDYRFVLADAFVRLVANGVLAGLTGWSIIALGAGRDQIVQAAIAIILVGLSGVAREVLQRLLTRLVFRQPDPEEVEASLDMLRSFSGPESEFLGVASSEMARLMKAPLVEQGGLPPISVGQRIVAAALVKTVPELGEFQRYGAAVAVPIRDAPAHNCLILLAERRGGRPYLSMDLEVLTRIGGVASEQLERILEFETDRLVSQAELRALQAQIHPHFLFNAFNTLYGIIPREAKAARKTVLNLADIFRYFLRTDVTLVPLEEEMRVVEAYLAIESQRLGDKLKVEIDIDPSLLRERVPVLTIEPLVENSIKHGVGAMPGGGTVRIVIAREAGASGQILVAVSDNGPGFGRRKHARPGNGVGLENVSRRLELCYGPEGGLMVDDSDGGTTVGFRVPRGERSAVNI